MADKPNKLLGALSLCRKAGALAVGFDTVREAALKGRALLVLFAQDVSPGTRKRILTTCRNPGIAHDTPLLQQDIAFITHKPAGVLAVTNKELAVLCLKALPPAQPDKEEIV